MTVTSFETGASSVGAAQPAKKPSVMAAAERVIRRRAPIFNLLGLDAETGWKLISEWRAFLPCGGPVGQEVECFTYLHCRERCSLPTWLDPDTSFETFSGARFLHHVPARHHLRQRSRSRVVVGYPLVPCFGSSPQASTGGSSWA